MLVGWRLNILIEDPFHSESQPAGFWEHFFLHLKLNSWWWLESFISFCFFHPSSRQTQSSFPKPTSKFQPLYPAWCGWLKTPKLVSLSTAWKAGDLMMSPPQSAPLWDLRCGAEGKSTFWCLFYKQGSICKSHCGTLVGLTGILLISRMNSSEMGGGDFCSRRKSLVSW